MQTFRLGSVIEMSIKKVHFDISINKANDCCILLRKLFIFVLVNDPLTVLKKINHLVCNGNNKELHTFIKYIHMKTK